MQRRRTNRRLALQSRRRSRPWVAGLLLIPLVALGFAGVAAAAATGVLYSAYQGYADEYLPLEETIQVRAIGLTQVYDRNGVLLGALPNYNASLIDPVPLEAIAPVMQQAMVSTEDDGFFEHDGFEPKALVRAAWDNYVEGGIGKGRGGSSITQQLVKTVYLTDDCEVVEGQKECIAPRTLDRKLKEIVFAIESEKRYSKEEILTWYLNAISFADRYVGVEAAAEGYFHKPAAELTLSEAAVLAGIPAAPTRYHPRLSCETDSAGQCIVDADGRTTVGGEARARQIHVLDLMVEHGRATREEADAAKAEVVKVYPAQNTILAAAFMDDQVEPRLVRMCEAGILPLLRGTEDCSDSVHSAGYHVTTTLDWAETQKALAMMNTFLTAGLAAGCDCHNAAITTIEPSTGQIIVYAPNIDPTWVSDKRVAGKIDQLVEINQPGSSFKPAVYLAWMNDLKKTPMSTIWDTSPLDLYDKPAKPSDQVTIVNPGQNSRGSGLITVRAALGGSQNVPAFRAAVEVGVDGVIAMAKKLGIITLDQGFDPTFRSHPDIDYGPSIATGGANVRPIDMAYMNSVISNMGVMVGVPTLAETLDIGEMHSISGAKDADIDIAMSQRNQFLRGDIRLPGTRELDPVTVLEVRSVTGEVLYQHGSDLQKKQVVDAGSVWMLHSIMSDCTARFLIWGCGSSNDDLSLDFFVDGTKIPGGIKTGTQQGFTSATDTLSTWMNGYSRYVATAVWVGNADKSLVRDGPSANYASANTTVRLFKNWMGQYHKDLKARGVFDKPADFQPPANVRQGQFQSATTERGRGGGCSQRVESWLRTDVDYQGGDCLGKSCVPLPTYKKDLAVKVAQSRGIPGCGVAYVAVASPSPTESPSPSRTAATTTADPQTTPTPRPAGTPTPSTPAQTPQGSPTSASTQTSGGAGNRGNNDSPRN